MTGDDPIRGRILIQSDVATVELDAVLSEVHETGAEVTSHPVERGAEVSDHIRAKPRALELVGVVTDYPIREASAEAQDWVAEVKERIERFESRRRWMALGGPLQRVVSAPDQPRPPALLRAGEGRSERAWEDLDLIRRSGALVTVITATGKDYPSMAITEMQRRRDRKTDSALHVSISLLEVVTVDSRSAQIPAELLRPASQGHQTPTPATPAQAEEATKAVVNKSAALQIFEALTGQ